MISTCEQPGLESAAKPECEPRTAIVTGGSRGLGQAIVRHLADSGYNIVFTYANGSYPDAVTDNGTRIRAMHADVRDANSAAAVVNVARQIFGHVDVLINNAGVIRDRPLPQMSEQEWDDVLDTNLRGAFLYSRAVSGAFMRQMSGRIINITSITGLRGVAGQANYAASKAGLIGLTKSLARELGPFNVTVNAVAPGFIETQMISHLNLRFRQQMNQRTPLGRFGTPSEVAAVIEFLASDKSSYITGQVIGVDGGLGI
jgi:3-oxoacyl-[acyl-carrier protein] reductase